MRRILIRVGAIVAVLAATFATGVAYLAWGLICDENCRPRPTQTIQLVVAIAGLIATVLLARRTWRGDYARALKLLVMTLALFAAWGLLLSDASQ